MKECQWNIWVRDTAALVKALILIDGVIKFSESKLEFHNDFLTQCQSSARTAIQRNHLCFVLFCLIASIAL